MANRQRNISCVSNMLHSLCWRTLQDKRKDARLSMIYRIDRDLVAISKDKRLIPPKRKMRLSHERASQMITCHTDRIEMAFFPRTVRDWNAISSIYLYLALYSAIYIYIGRFLYDLVRAGRQSGTGMHYLMILPTWRHWRPSGQRVSHCLEY